VELVHRRIVRCACAAAIGLAAVELAAVDAVSASPPNVHPLEIAVSPSRQYFPAFHTVGIEPCPTLAPETVGRLQIRDRHGFLQEKDAVFPGR